jgi:hypothetical protein
MPTRSAPFPVLALMRVTTPLIQANVTSAGIPLCLSSVRWEVL